MKLLKKFIIWLAIGICTVLALQSCGESYEAKSPNEVYKVLQEKIIPKIATDKSFINDSIARNYAISKIENPLPKIETFPLFAAQSNQNSNTIYLEIFTSPDKGDGDKQDERWMVDVAEAFNAKKLTVNSGKTIQIGIRSIPSGIAAQLIAAGNSKPAGFTPSHDLWLEILKSNGLKPIVITSKLAANGVGFVVEEKTYGELAKNGSLDFDTLLNAILSAKISIGYPNPYTSSSSLNLLYTLLWKSAGHDRDNKPLTIQDLESSQVTSVFDTFQKQVVTTTTTTIDLKDIFLRDRQKLQAFPLDYQNYQALKKIPGFEQTGYVPFGVAQNNPLVGFNWNTPAHQEALKKFAEFANSSEMQKLAAEKGFGLNDYLKKGNFPPTPKGEVLSKAQSFWKQRKDGGKTVYMMMVIDTSGSMDGDRIKGVKEGLRQAIGQINAGNQVGLVTFSDNPKYVVPLAPFDKLQNQRLLAAIDSLVADGATNMYDGTLVALSELLTARQKDPNGRFYILLLSDGEANRGFNFSQIKDLLANSDTRIYPIAYGEVNQEELKAIASLRESTVKAGNPDNVKELLRDLFQVNL
jgi:Ca-activated chloride channel family protein